MRERKTIFKSSNIPLWLAGIFFIIFLFAIQNSGLGKVLKITIFRIMDLARPFLAAGVGGFSASQGDLLGKLQSLQEENRRLNESVVELESLRQENATLRRALGAPFPTSSYRPLPAKVIGVAPTKTKEIIYLRIGENSSIKPGDIVILPERTLVGKIIEVVGEYASSQTIFDSEIKIAAKILPTGSQGLFVNPGTPKLSLLSPNTDPQPGNLVVTSGQDGIFPEGLLLGKILQIQSQPAEPFSEATLELALEIGNLNTVMVISNPLR